ncbi:MAG: Two component transcriptional regulator, LytTR family [Thermotoga sp. 50_1627]|uniref:LytR/AlgR family response regulator transcription factor n=1 Tax=Pseudothermotoga sp. TaxID=2033661 RepID=UPI00076CAB76|nr:MAG: Two component transcriptional regulator, LytTR family [Thermotoga sp. 50_64]KUK24401.1 MAG: Two component transcriptional regulator, LytTR family [Thermotoga sp. 50_1627]MBC7116421.1 response regulator transcription factor [Pseudothermotoga sp.]MDK2923512.1 two-component system, LytTR family, response regulator LytT [Pseudothermotoga sp.]HBT39792.1 DNA-binding response regulator [Pseudothermotoga sp.]
MIRVAILEDEQLARDSLVQMVSKYPDLKLVGAFASSREFLKHVSKIDVAFIDIKLPSESGVNIARRLKKVGIVFVTAYEEYAAQAFEIGAIDYLVKPVREERFQLCVERILQAYSRPLLKLPVREGRNVLMLDFKGIFYIEAFGKRCVAATEEGEYEVYHWNLAELERRLPDNFLRVHKSYICNIDKVRKLIRFPTLQIEMENGRVIPVSKTYQRTVKSFLFQ